MNGNASAHQHQSQPRYQPPNSSTYYVTHDFSGPATLSTTLVHALADVAGVDVTDTEFCLDDHVDPDALNHLFEPKSDGTARTNGTLSLTVWGYQVTIYGDGQIAITEPVQQQSRTTHR
ncbi:HalOD1 output domain-containing protein [Halobacteriales archaeon Cl-PHB]